MRTIRKSLALTTLVLWSSVLVGCQLLQGTPELRFSDPESVGLSSEALRNIRTAFQPYIDEDKTPGFITLVARDGKIVHYDAFGPRDVENGLPMETDTIIRMYSMTKPITAVAVMQQVDRGRLSVDDPVADYIPEFAHAKVVHINEDGTHELVPVQTPITIKHLLTHTSGLSYGFMDEQIQPYYAEAGLENFWNSSLEDFGRNAASAPLKHEPGAGYTYSIGMDVLGRIVEITSGRDYGEYLQRYIFDPLGMADSGFWVPEEKQGRFSVCYQASEDKESMEPVSDVRAGRFTSQPSMASGGGGMVGTVSDYYRFAQMLLNGGELDGVRILSERSAAEIMSDHTTRQLGPDPMGSEENPRPGHGIGYCGGVLREGVDPKYGSPGNYYWGGLASTMFFIDRRENLVAIAGTQLIPSSTHPLRPAFTEAVYNAIRDHRARN